MSDLANIRMNTTGFLMCNNPEHAGDSHWCTHLKNYISSGDDTAMLHADQHIQVPIFPTADVFGEIWIGNDIGNGAGLMSLNFTPDIGRPYSVQLGFWNPGEGMASIREVILDFVRSRIDPNEDFSDPNSIKTKCPTLFHGVKESRIMSENASNLKWKWQCLWNIVMEKACTPCIAVSTGDSSNFGVDDSVVPKRRWT